MMATMSWQMWALDYWLRMVEKPRIARENDIRRTRARMERVAWLLAPYPPTKAEERLLGDLRSLRVPAPNGGEGRLLLWFHGGGYCVGSPRSHLELAVAVARRAGAGVVLPTYRLAPEHPFPAAAEDAYAAYCALLAEGVDPARLVIGGDSAGGGLAFGLLHTLLAEGLPRPAGIVAFSPWTDLTLSGESLSALAARDAVLPAQQVEELRALYLAGSDATDPRASPILGRFRGAPPTLIQASAHEILRDDARAMAARLERDGAATTLELWPGAPHVWQGFGRHLPEAGAALDRAGAFMRELW